ncbi:MAG TPA: GNAT family N-acetyltransferase [Candidatus Binatia bacterium]|nr:GNAT family N-acetyltransferase [Candidatus Binatia bacterium]
MTPPATIRPYQPRDLADLYEVCVRTGHAGGDARGIYRSDDLLPDIFLGPYVYLEPERAFVLDCGFRAVGYVVGTADTAVFVRACKERWIPRLAGRYPAPRDPPLSPDDSMLALHYSPELLLWDGVEAYPAHLHINLLAEFQGMGYGRRLMGRFFEAAFATGARGVHLFVDSRNVGALSFYARLRFHRLQASGRAVILGRTLP